jgi:hypothetical protein
VHEQLNDTLQRRKWPEGEHNSGRAEGGNSAYGVDENTGRDGVEDTDREQGSSRVGVVRSVSANADGDTETGDELEEERGPTRQIGSSWSLQCVGEGKLTLNRIPMPHFFNVG